MNLWSAAAASLPLRGYKQPPPLCPSLLARLRLPRRGIATLSPSLRILFTPSGLEAAPSGLGKGVKKGGKGKGVTEAKGGLGAQPNPEKARALFRKK
jgi:hypothetical protein